MSRIYYKYNIIIRYVSNYVLKSPAGSSFEILAPMWTRYQWQRISNIKVTIVNCEFTAMASTKIHSKIR